MIKLMITITVGISNHVRAFLWLDVQLELILIRNIRNHIKRLSNDLIYQRLHLVD